MMSQALQMDAVIGAAIALSGSTVKRASIKKWTGRKLLAISLGSLAMFVAVAFTIKWNGVPVLLMAAGYACALLPTAMASIWVFRRPAMATWPFGVLAIVWAVFLGMVVLFKQLQGSSPEVIVYALAGPPVLAFTWSWFLLRGPKGTASVDVGASSRQEGLIAATSLESLARYRSTADQAILGGSAAALVGFFMPWVSLSWFGFGGALESGEKLASSAAYLWVIPASFIGALLLQFHSMTVGPQRRVLAFRTILMLAAAWTVPFVAVIGTAISSSGSSSAIGTGIWLVAIGACLVTWGAFVGIRDAVFSTTP